MTSYILLIQKLETFCNSHLQIEKFGTEFKEQMTNFATIDEKYPIVYVTPVSFTTQENTNLINVDIYCYDLIQADRVNINTIISDAQQILNDIYLEFKYGNDVSIDVVSSASFTPLNNDLLDYAAGWVMNITFEVDAYTQCYIPTNSVI